MLKVCPVDNCGGDLRPHCVPIPEHPLYSHTCDLVKCVRCNARGTLEGRYWPKSDAVVKESTRRGDRP
jgi:hypothetical protein